MWLNIYLDLPLGPAGLETCSIDQSIELPPKSTQAKLFNTWHELNNVIPSSPNQSVTNMSTHVGALLQQLSTPYDTDQRSLNHLKRCEDYLHNSNSLTQISVKSLPLYISPSSGLFFISPDEDLLFEVETSWVTLLCKFQCWWSELNWHCKCYQIKISDFHCGTGAIHAWPTVLMLPAVVVQGSL